MAAPPRPGSMRSWPSTSGSSPTIPKQAQIDVWGDDPLAVASSSLAPRAAAKPVAGRLAAQRQLPFSSGCDYAQWAMIGAFLGEMGDTRHVAYLLVPLSDVEIVDDWQVLGLAGTGSKSLVLHDVFVPEHRMRDGQRFLRRHPAGRAGASRLSGGVGAARLSRVVFAAAGGDRARRQGARGRCAGLSRTRVSRGVTRLAQSEVVQMAVGEAGAAIDIATHLLHSGRDYSSDAVARAAGSPTAEALRARRDMVYAQHQVKWAVDRLCELCGARWIYDSDPLQEIRRDIEIILTHHAASRMAAMVPWGRSGCCNRTTNKPGAIGTPRGVHHIERDAARRRPWLTCGTTRWAPTASSSSNTPRPIRRRSAALFERMGFVAVGAAPLQERHALPPGRHQLHRQRRAGQLRPGASPACTGPSVCAIAFRVKDAAGGLRARARRSAPSRCRGQGRADGAQHPGDRGHRR